MSEENIVAGSSAAQSADELGLTVQTITPELARLFNKKAGIGVLISQVESGSIAAMAGIKSGTVILEVDRNAVNFAEEFKREVIKSAADKRILSLISDAGMSRYVVLNWR